MRLVGIGQRGSRYLAAEAHVIELALHGAQASFDVTETLTEGQLSKRKTKKLIEARKASEFIIAIVPRHALLELVWRKVIHQLSEDETAGVHASLSEPARGYEDGGQNGVWKFKSKNLEGPLISMTTQRLSTRSEAIAGHYCAAIDSVEGFGRDRGDGRDTPVCANSPGDEAWYGGMNQAPAFAAPIPEDAPAINGDAIDHRFIIIGKAIAIPAEVLRGSAFPESAAAC